MNVRPLRTYDVESREQTQVAIDDITDAVNGLVASKLGNDHYIRAGVPLGTANFLVHHNLGRVPTLLFPLMVSAGVIIYSDTPTDDPKNSINVKATATCVATLLIA